MYNQITDIHRWNKDRGLLGPELNRKLEGTMLLEEVLEGLGHPHPKDESKKIVNQILDRKDLIEISEIGWLDHLCDIEFILHGSKAKLGLSPLDDLDSLQAIIDANNYKKSKKDSDGKIIKTEEWNQYAPEPRLEKILNRRN
jgi:hypothetical protein